MEVWVWLVGFVLVLLVVASVEWYVDLKRRKTPGPKGVPLLYCLPDLLWHHDTLFDHVVEETLRHGKTYSLRIPLIPRIFMVIEPDCVDHILRRNFENYGKGVSFINNMHDLLGNGIFNTNGRLWKIQRQIASSIFTVNALKDMVEVFNAHSKHTVDKLLKLQQDQAVDVQDIFGRCTLDSVGEIAFGVDFKSQFGDVEFFHAFNEALRGTDFRFTWPFWVWMPWLKSERKLRAAIASLNSFADSIIQQRKQDPNLHERKDLLSRYMARKDDNGNSFNDSFLRDILMNYMLAGRDTTAQTLTWTFFLLSQNASAEEKLLQEIDDVFGDDEVVPTFENVKNMKYLKAVIDETLRLYPPVPLDPKEACEQDVLPNGVVIPKGSVVQWSAYVMGRHPDFWHEPKSFLPERWFGENGGKPIPANAPPFIPFQYGPRICLGQQMAYLEVKIVICSILRKLKLRLSPNFTPQAVPTLTLSAKNGMLMTVSPRNKS